MSCTPAHPAPDRMVLDCVVLDCPDIAGPAAFWSALLGWPSVGQHGGLRSPDGPGLSFTTVAELPPGAPRAHLDLACASHAEQRTTVDRARELGARPADIGQHDVPWEVLADPYGTLFCVREPRPEYRDTGRIGAVLLDANDLNRMAGFWTAATGWPVRRTGPRLAALRSPTGRGPWLELWHTTEPKRHRNPLHPHVSGPDHDTGLRSLLHHGARRGGPGTTTWTALVDPEGNELCLRTRCNPER